MSLVDRIELPTNLSDLDEYIKPLDIMKVYGKVRGRTMVHSGIYLGNGKVAHADLLAQYMGSYYGEYGYGFYGQTDYYIQRERER